MQLWRLLRQGSAPSDKYSLTELGYPGIRYTRSAYDNANDAVRLEDRLWGIKRRHMVVLPHPQIQDSVKVAEPLPRVSWLLVLSSSTLTEGWDMAQKSSLCILLICFFLQQ
jgi:hypothetical protein